MSTSYRCPSRVVLKATVGTIPAAARRLDVLASTTSLPCLQQPLTEQIDATADTTKHVLVTSMSISC